MTVDDEGIVQLLQNLALIANSIVVIGIDRNFGHVLAAIPFDQKCDGGGTGAQLPKHVVTTGEDISRLSVRGVAYELIARGGQLILDLIEELDELFCWSSGRTSGSVLYWTS